MTPNYSEDQILVPALMVPSFKTFVASKDGTIDDIMIKSWGGLGDQICAEPALRYASSLFPTSKVYLATENPDLFSHLDFLEKVYDLRTEAPNWDDYFVFNTILPPDNLLWQFISHMLSHPVDFSSICMWRMQLPVGSREIRLPDYSSKKVDGALADRDNTVVIHAGRHWASKTFPSSWWESIISEFQKQNFRVVLIGKEVDKNTGFVHIKSIPDVTDLRNSLTLKEFISICKNAKFLFSNDSSPIHAAAAGDGYIGFVASCKHPDYLKHWRKGQWGWRTKNFELDGPWNHINHAPNQTEKVEVESLPAGLMEALLPNPKDVVDHYTKWKLGELNVS